MKVLAMIPTYNESENIARLIEALLALDVPGLEVLVVDDNSPDGTAEIAADFVRRDPRVHLLRRGGPAGRGLAGRDGFLFALKAGADFLIEMDGDFSHDPKRIPAFLEAMRACDVAVGSRMVAGGTDLDRPLFRRWLTIAANAYARRLLGVAVQDTNSGFRCFSRRALEVLEPETLRSLGPSIVHEVLFRAARRGLKISEIPVDFVDRKQGYSKLSFARLLSGYFWILKMRFMK